DWPPQWLADVHSAFQVLAAYPTATDATVVAHYDFLWDLGAVGEAARILEEGVLRFPASAVLHDRFRGLTLERHGVAGLEPAYVALLAKSDAPVLRWYAGLASLVAAEFRRRAF